MTKDLRTKALISFAFALLTFIPCFAQSAADWPEATDIRRVNGGDFQMVCSLQGRNYLQMDSFGDEASMSFTINWDPRLVQFLEISNGSSLPPGAVITTDKSQLALGKLGISIVSTTAFPKGRITIVELTLITVREIEQFSPSITFSSSPTPQSTRDINGNELPTIYANGRFVFGACDPSTMMSIIERPAAFGTAVLDVNIRETFSQFSGETSFRFSMVWDPSLFTFLAVQPGTGLSPGSTVTLDESQIERGRVGVRIDGTGPLPPFSQNLNLIYLQLRKVNGIDNGRFYVHFSDSPVRIATLDASGVPRFGSGLAPGTISIGTQTSLTGTLRRPSGQPLANTVVVLQGTAFTATTSSFGVFTFPNIPHGYGFVVQARSKRYRFASVPFYLNQAVNIEMRGLE